MPSTKKISLFCAVLWSASSWAAAAPAVEPTATVPITWGTEITMPDQATLAKQLKTFNLQMLDIGVPQPLSAQLGTSTKTLGEIITTADDALAAVTKDTVRSHLDQDMARLIATRFADRRPTLHACLLMHLTQKSRSTALNIVALRGVYDLPLGVTLVIDDERK